MTEELEVQATGEESVDQPLSVREELQNALKDVQEKEVPTTESVVEKTSRQRDETGKFARKEEKTELTTNADNNLSKTDVNTKEIEVKQVTAPQSWSAQAKAKWAEIPADIRTEIARREEEVHKGFTRLDEERNFGKQLKDVINPYMPIITAEGGNPAAAIKDLLNTAYQLRTGSPQQKSALLREIARVYGADLTQLTPSSAPYVDPTVHTMQQRIDALEKLRQQEVNQQKQHYQASIQSEIATFASNPANIHFNTVAPHMIAILNSNLATGNNDQEILKDAYDQAVYARPDIRSTLIAQQHTDAEAKRLADIKAKTQAARNASSSVTGAPGVAVANKGAPERSLREELKANFRAAIQ